MIKRVVLFFLTILCMVCFCGCELNGREIKLRTEMPDTELFEMGDLVCTPSELKVFLANYKNIYGSIYDTDFWEGCQDVSEMSEKIKDAAFAHLTKVYALDLYAEVNGVALTEDEVNICSKAAAEYYESLNETEKSYMQITPLELDDLVRDYVLAKKSYAKVMEGVNPEVSDDEARIMDAIIIYNTDKTKVEEAYEKAEDTRDFASLAANYSQLSYINATFGRGEYDSEVEEKVFTLDNGEYTDILEVNGGYMIFYCTNKYDEELSAQRKEKIYNERKTQALDEIYSYYQKEVNSILNKELYEKMSVDASPEIKTNNFFQLVDSYISFR